jgi:hypothetical protein
VYNVSIQTLYGTQLRCHTASVSYSTVVTPQLSISEISLLQLFIRFSLLQCSVLILLLLYARKVHCEAHACHTALSKLRNLFMLSTRTGLYGLHQATSSTAALRECSALILVLSYARTVLRTVLCRIGLVKSLLCQIFAAILLLLVPAVALAGAKRHCNYLNLCKGNVQLYSSCNCSSVLWQFVFCQP